jgi:benzoate 4-monooxygenase
VRPFVHGNCLLTFRSDFYDAFVTVSPGLFSTRDRDAHTRKRKIISHSFSAKSVTQFEQYMHSNIDEFTKQWDLLCSKEIALGQVKDYARLDCCQWFNYLTFDTIGDLAFGAPFGMLKAGGKDAVEIMERPGARPKVVNAIESFNKRGAAFAALGW